MRILITGGCGFLGSHLIDYFLRNTDATIVVVDKLTQASHGFERMRLVRDAFGEQGFTQRVKMLGGVDLGLPVTDGVLMEIDEVDYIIHAAAESHVDNSIVDPLPFLHSNVIGTHHVLMAARRIPSVKRVIMVSTDEVYGPSPAMPGLSAFNEGYHATCARYGFDELSRYRPANPYAAAKAGGEAVAMAYANTYKIPVTIVNTMNLIGERQHHEKFVPLVIRKVFAGEPVTIHADSTRSISGSRFYLHCGVLAHAMHWIINDEKERSARDGGYPIKLHVCGEKEISNLDLAQTIAKLIGRPLSYELVDFHSSRPGHDLRYAMQDRMIQTLGWKRPMGIEQSLERTVKWYLDNPTWFTR